MLFGSAEKTKIRSPIAAFEKARAKRAANRAASAPAALFRAEGACAAPAAPLFRAESACPEPAAPTAPAPAPAALVAEFRKARTDKGEKRGYLMRPAETHEAEGLYPQPPRSGYDPFVIVL